MTLTMVGAAPVVVLDGSGCSPADVGGKAAGLDRLAFHGFPIPKSAAVTVAGYRRFVEAAGLEPQLASLRRSPLPGPGDLDLVAAEIEEMFLAPAIPDNLSGAIAEAVAPMLANGSVAVRSSANAEDLGTASFAGQYRTFVRVGDLEGVLHAVRRCWASLWMPSASAYRRQSGIAEDHLAMGVVLQSTVDADWSGVGFTRDPGSSRDTLRIEVVAGLGEALVSGRVTPDDFVVRRDSLTVAATDHATPPPFLEDLARMLLQVEDRLDAPQDVEWAAVSGALVLLQARPITVAGPTTAFDDGFDGPRGTTDDFTPRGVVEMLPGVVPPLVWTINAPMLEHAFRTAVAALAAGKVDSSHRFVGRFNGRPALNLSALREVAEALPGGSTAEVEQQFLGRVVTEGDAPSSRAGLGSVFRARRLQRRLGDEVDLIAAATQGVVDLGVEVRELPASSLLAYRAALRDLAWRLTTAEVAASSAAAAAYRGLEQLLGRWFDEEGAATRAQQLTSGALAEDAVGMVVSATLEAVYRKHVTRTPSLRSAMVARPSSRIPVRLHQLGPAGDALCANVAATVRALGCRSTYAGPTWLEDRSALWDQLALCAALDDRRQPTSQPDAPIERVAAELSTRRRWMLLRVLTGQVVDLRKRWLQRQAAEAVHFLRLRERAKRALLALGGEERRIVLEGGKRFAASHQLDDQADVELLSDQEFVAMILGAPPPSNAEVNRRRVVQARCAAAEPLPEVFMGAPGAAAHSLVSVGDDLVGWAASPGRVEGPVRVLRSLADGSRLGDGEVLVAHTTDPSWTPLLLVAGGLVLEEGGPLSHGAIVAREFGVPAVLNVNGATRALADGSVVEVDGFAGVVHRVVKEAS